MFGKILVTTHVALSLIFASWAMALYLTRVDFSDNQGKAGKPDGELFARKADFERITKHDLKPLDARWRANRGELEKQEYYRPIERPWYKKQIAFLKQGATETDSAKQLERDANGNAIPADVPTRDNILKMGPVRDKDGNPIQDRNNQVIKLKSIEHYDKEDASTQGQITVALGQLADAKKRDLDATNSLKGPRGFLARIKFEEAKQDQIKEEFAEVRPLMLKTAVELQNLRQLLSRLEERLRELGSQGDKLK